MTDNNKQDQKQEETTTRAEIELLPLSLSAGDADKENYKDYFGFLDQVLIDDKEKFKNIGITGEYGCGKSSLWKHYVNHVQTREDNKKDADFDKKIIKVSLANYVVDDEVDKRTIENRLERQIINQIVSQIDPNQIPESKFRFKQDNIQFNVNLIKVICTLPFLLLLYRHTSNICFEIVYFLILALVSCWVYYYLKNNPSKLTKLTNIKTPYFELNKETSETIFDLELREIVYLIEKSKAEIIVIEDLDRFKGIGLNIFTKLQEINFILNNRFKSTNQNRIIKFVYMVNDGVFTKAKDPCESRTKFFDVIIPVVPIADRFNAKEHFVKILKENKANIEYVPHHHYANKRTDDKYRIYEIIDGIRIKYIEKISEYTKNMRVVNNILNEYYIYKQKISNVGNEALFVLIGIKNLFPDDFRKYMQRGEDTLKEKDEQLNAYLSKYGFLLSPQVELTKDEQGFINAIKTKQYPKPQEFDKLEYLDTPIKHHFSVLCNLINNDDALENPNICNFALFEYCIKKDLNMSNLQLNAQLLFVKQTVKQKYLDAITKLLCRNKIQQDQQFFVRKEFKEFAKLFQNSDCIKIIVEQFKSTDYLNQSFSECRENTFIDLLVENFSNINLRASNFSDILPILKEFIKTDTDKDWYRDVEPRVKKLIELIEQAQSQT